MTKKVLQNSFSRIEKSLNRLGEETYRALMAQSDLSSAVNPFYDPSEGIDIFNEGLRFLVDHVDHPEMVQNYFRSVRERYRGFAVGTQHYQLILDEWLKALERLYGSERWRHAEGSIWNEAFRLAREVLCDTGGDSPSDCEFSAKELGQERQRSAS